MKTVLGTLQSIPFRNGRISPFSMRMAVVPAATTATAVSEAFRDLFRRSGPDRSVADLL